MIAVNARSLGRRIGGVERYTRAMLRHLPGEVRVVQPEGGRQGWRGHLWEQLTLPGMLLQGDLLWSPANTGPVRVQGQVLTLHDASPIDHPEWYPAGFRLLYRVLLPSLTRRVRAVITDSEFSRRRIAKMLAVPQGKLTVVPCGVDLEVFRPLSQGAADSAAAAFGLESGYILYVGSRNPRKNLPVLLAAWRDFQRLHPDLKLVLAGPGMAAKALGAGVVELGYVDEKSLPLIYAAAQVLVLPSVYEGFGLPALEAMACGVPVIAARAGAIPEVVGDAGLLIEPGDDAAIAAGLELIVGSPARAAQLAVAGLERSKQFSWQQSANAVWDVLMASSQAD